MGQFGNGQNLTVNGSRIAITKALSSKSTGPLPAQTIKQILSTRNFTNQNAQIQEWIKEQVMECEIPIHPIMAELLDLYAQSCIPERENQICLQPISESFIHENFVSDIYDTSKLVARVLFLYYMLNYTYLLDTKSLPASFQNGPGPFRYSSELWAKIPIRYLLSLIDARPIEFQPVRSSLFKITAFTMPHMLPTLAEALEYHHGNVENSSATKAKPLVSEEQLVVALKELPNSFVKFSRLIEYVDASPIQHQHIHMKVITEAMAATLHPSTPRSLIVNVCSVWNRLSNVVPRHVYEATFRHLLDDKSLSTDNELLVSQPLALFRVNERVFVSPDHFQCLMNMLEFYLDANRAWNQGRINQLSIQNALQTDGDREKSDLSMALENVQNSAIIQMLLEICDGDPVEKPYLEEIRRIACAQIHEMFIANINLAKLVHFQTYPIRLIPVMIKGVPSTHVVISYINELLATPNIQRRIFAIVLTAELIDQYKHVDSFVNLELIVQVLETLLDVAPGEQNVDLFLNIVPTIERFVKVSPFTADSYIELLQRVRQMAASRLAVFSSIFASRHSPEQLLLELVEKSLEKCRNN